MIKEYYKSPLKYTGRKISILPQIEPLFPKEDSYKVFVDCFAGSMDVSLNAPADKAIVVNDIRCTLINCYKSIRVFQDDISEYYKSKIKYYDGNLDTYEISKENFFKFREDLNTQIKDNNGDMKDILLFSMYSFCNMLRFNNKGFLNVSYGERHIHNSDFDLIKIFKNSLDILDIKFTSFDFRTLLQAMLKSKIPSELFLYLDPPYIITDAPYSNSWNELCEKELYMLLEKLNNNNIKFALSNVIEHKNKFNKELYEFSKIQGLETIEIDKNYDSCSGAKNKVGIKTKTKEILIRNYKE